MAHPDGVVAQYMKHAHVALVVGDTLVVHGAVVNSSMGFLPSERNRDRIQTSVVGTELAKTHRWVAARWRCPLME